MKIGIIGDTHLGAALSIGKKDHSAGINSRLVDYNNTLIATIDDLIIQGCTQIVFTGDIFEHRTPTIKQQELFSTALRHAVENGISQIHIVVGNHDQQRITNATTLSYIKELPLPNIHVYDEMDMFVARDDDGEIKANLIFMPYRDRKWLNVATNKGAIELLEQQLMFHVSSIDNDAPKILIGHMTIEGTLWMLEQYADLYNGNDLILPTEMFNSINITIMGHVHTPGLVSKKPFIAYVGSMEKRSASEDHKKKYMVIDLDRKKIAELDEPCREIYDIRMDFSGSPKDDSLMNNIYHEIDVFASTRELKESIVKVSLTMDGSDDKFCNTEKISDYILETYKVFHCVEIKPALIFSRQSRDDRITEHSSDTESFKRYVENEFKLHGLKDNILELGLGLIDGDNQ